MTQLDLIDAPHTQTREEWLIGARAVAKTIARMRGKVSADDLNEVYPPPKGVDPRIMGSVFSGFRCVGYRKSRRAECHHRPIADFVYDKENRDD